MKIGIVGLPNVGKSTLFNALTHSYAAEAANFPFCTIEPNVGIVNVYDERLEALKIIMKSSKVVPATIEFVDIAWIVKGASQGEGLGNKFLSHIREVDAVLEVIRNFEDTDIHHVNGSIDPKRDIETIKIELILADIETLWNRMNEFMRRARSGDANAKKMESLCSRLMIHLEENNLAITLDMTHAERLSLHDLHLLTLKPFLYALNVSEDAIMKPIDTVKLWLEPRVTILPMSAKLEMDMLWFSPEERQEFLESMGITTNPLDQIIHTCYDLLGLQYYFTAWEMESRAWRIRKWATAPEAAGVIHTDFHKKFIKAETVNWRDLVDFGWWAGAREKWKVRMEWKEYIVQDGDVMVFKFWA